MEKPGWIIDSTGFAGPGERYTLAMMNSLEGEGGYHAGTDTLNQVAAILFAGTRCRRRWSAPLPRPAAGGQTAQIQHALPVRYRPTSPKAARR